MVAGDFAKIPLSLDASALDYMLLQKLAQALRFDILGIQGMHLMSTVM